MGKHSVRGFYASASLMVRGIRIYMDAMWNARRVVCLSRTLSLWERATRKNSVLIVKTPAQRLLERCRDGDYQLATVCVWVLLHKSIYPRIQWFTWFFVKMGTMTCQFYWNIRKLIKQWFYIRFFYFRTRLFQLETSCCCILYSRYIIRKIGASAASRVCS